MENIEIERKKLERSIYILDRLSTGVNPFDESKVLENNDIDNEKLENCFKYVSGILNDLLENKYVKLEKVKQMEFTITKEQKENVKFPSYPIGIAEFTRCINEVIDTEKVKKLNAVNVTKGLKKMDILHEIKIAQTGRTKTIINPDASQKYGISVITFEKNGIKIEKIIYDDIGKKFLLDNLEDILSNSN